MKRIISKEEAAEYCGLSLNGFSNWVRRGIIPGALPGTTKWDLKAIDLALDKHSGLLTAEAATAAEDPLEQWLQAQDEVETHRAPHHALSSR